MKILEKFIDLFRVRLRENISNPLWAGVRRSKLINSSFTIISNNCWGGHVYRYFNAPYDSPTIGLFIFSEDYIKFISDIKHYLSLELKFITAEESKFRKTLEARRETHVPIGVLEDVEIIFLHYKSQDEAREKWNRRKARIHWDNIVYKMTEQNLCSLEHLKTFEALPLERKFVFTSEDYGLKSQVICDEWTGKGEVSNDTLHFRKYVNLIKLLNNKPFRKRQK